MTRWAAVAVVLSWLVTPKCHARLMVDSVDSSPTEVYTDVVNIVRMLEPVRKVSIQYLKEAEDVTDLIRGLDVPVIVNAEEEGVPDEVIDTKLSSDVVILLQPAVNVSTLLDITTWARFTYFFVVFPNGFDEENHHHNLLDTFAAFWKRNAVNVLVFVSRSDSPPRLYRYLPFSAEGCDRLKVYELDLESVDEHLLRTGITNYNQCTINVSAVDVPPQVLFPSPESSWGTFEIGGTETAIVKEVARKLNFTPWYSRPKDGYPWGWIHPTPRGAVGEVYRKYSHYALGLLTNTMERLLNLDVTVPIGAYIECVSGAVPYGAAKKRMPWVEIYLSEFSGSMWMCILATFGLGTLSFWLLARVYRLRYTPLIVFLKFFSSFLNVPIRVPGLGPLRWIFLVWIWYSLVIILSYESVMRSKLTVPYRPEEIETVLDLLESDLHYVGPQNLIRVISTKAEGDLKRMASLIRPIDYDIKEGINKILMDGDVAVMAVHTMFKYWSMVLPGARGNVHFMKECAFAYYPIIVMQRYSPLTNTTNRILRRLLEAGILAKWRSEYIYDIPQGNPPAIRLSLKHVLLPLIALVSGLIVSTVVFILEILYSRVYK